MQNCSVLTLMFVKLKRRLVMFCDVVLLRIRNYGSCGGREMLNTKSRCFEVESRI